MPKALEERVPYSAIVDRPKLTLPGNARLAVWVIVNVENWEIRRPMPRMVLPPPSGVPLLPDLPNWAWHEYGMRVGFWRFLECLTHRNIVPTLALNGSVCQRYSARLRSCGRRRVGVYGAWLRPNADAQPGRPAWRDPPNR